MSFIIFIATICPFKCFIAYLCTFNEVISLAFNQIARLIGLSCWYSEGKPIFFDPNNNKECLRIYTQ